MYPFFIILYHDYLDTVLVFVSFCEIIWKLLFWNICFVSFCKVKYKFVKKYCFLLMHVLMTLVFCSVSRLHCESESFKMDLILDVNTQIYPVDLGTHLWSPVFICLCITVSLMIVSKFLMHFSLCKNRWMSIRLSLRRTNPGPWSLHCWVSEVGFSTNRWTHWSKFYTSNLVRGLRLCTRGEKVKCYYLFVTYQ